MSEPHVPTAAAQQPSAETTTNASLAADATAHTSPQAPPPPTASGASTVSVSVAEAKSVAATLSDVADSTEPLLVGKVVSSDIAQARSQPCTSGLNAAQSGAGAPVGANVGKQDRCSPPAKSTSSSSSSHSGDESSDEAADFETKELMFAFGRYVGQVNPRTGLRHGHGCQHYNNGNVYTGEWRDGAPDGFGEKHYRNGDVYRGNWRQGKRSGRGVYLFVQGDIYEGMYADDKPEGQGTYATLRGDRYSGQWKAGQRHGKGRETLANGQVFVGNWRCGKKQGRGKLCLPGSEKCIYGIWNNDRFFRELTPNEMGADGAEDVVDAFGAQRRPSAPSLAPPRTEAPPSSASITDRVLMGVTALENRMESLGRALERVITGGDGDESAHVPRAAAIGAASSTASDVAVSEECAEPPAQDFVVNSHQENDEDGEQG
ncbi:MORN repeat-containing protein [Leishmania donovani]|uniref:MORN repeat family protein n=1 Tax=Leishmania donovani TaxID=5661 RepID=A0A504XD52_LEIDO|nr:MORN repeat family protein [Leishmania donovani]CAJ1988354.1 MORN repeat-containing protein [Leishmania donovani]VDZ44238.1 MORN_repeat_putative/Pfam:PF02493 [Leishmania donovani]